MEQRDLGAPDIRIHWVKVHNLGDTDYTDRFDGVPVVIEHGRSQNLQLDMAAHMFGYHLDATPEAMFRHTCKRQGWNTPKHLERDESGKTLAERLFGKLRIEPVIMRMVEEKPDLDSPIPADPVPEEIPPLPKRHRAGAA